MNKKIITAITVAVLTTIGAGYFFQVSETVAADEIVVYKSPTCGCCSKWITHLRDNGFKVKATDVPDVKPYKMQYGLPGRLGACHTAVVGGYVVEGHVPADDIKRLLEDRLDVKGIAVPGMPMGSPGMEGSRKDPYVIWSFDAEGNTRVYSRH